MMPPSTPGAGGAIHWSAATKDHVTGQQAEKEPVGVSVLKELLREPPSPAWEPMNEVPEPMTSPPAHAPQSEETRMRSVQLDSHRQMPVQNLHKKFTPEFAFQFCQLWDGTNHFTEACLLICKMDTVIRPSSSVCMDRRDYNRGTTGTPSSFLWGRLGLGAPFAGTPSQFTP